jgi:CelD/BcsL family acetyltransferase involved in cellulose biosynthesis
MRFEWPDNTKGRLRHELLTATHDAHTSPHFTDEGLAKLLDIYPRENLGIYKFPPHAEGRVQAIHGQAPNLSGAEILKAVETGQIWLNLRKVNDVLPEYETIAKDIFGQLDAASGEGTLKRDVGVLISSPNIHVHYHLDVPMVCLVQIRGEKTLHLYPPHPPFAPDNQIEAVALKEREEDIEFLDAFDASATKIVMQPGLAVTWPQNAPHRVQNGNMMNVSLSCEFMTAPALIRANAIYTNGVIRRRLGHTPAPLKKVGPQMIAKAAIARGIKLFNRPTGRGPTPITFQLNPDTLQPEPIEPRQTSTIQAPQLSTIRYECIAPDELTTSAKQQWSALCASSREWQSPLLSPQFAILIGEARSDVQCALAWQDDKLVAAMAVHVRPGGLARPVGAPFDDYSGPVIAAGTKLSPDDLVKGCGLHAYRAHAAAVPTTTQTSQPNGASGYLIQLKPGQTGAQYLEERRALHPKRMKNFRRLARKFETDLGDLQLRWGAPDPERLSELMSWKSLQFRDSGLIDLTKATNSKRVLDQIAANPSTESSELGGFVVELLSNDKLVAAHFGVRLGKYFHPWLAAYDPKYAIYAPGILLLYRIIEQLDDIGLDTYDLADGSDHYKKYFADPIRQTRILELSSGTTRGNLQMAGSKMWSLIGAKKPHSPADRLKRRLDQISICEPGVFVRTGQVVSAVKNRTFAHASETPHATSPNISHEN